MDVFRFFVKKFAVFLGFGYLKESAKGGQKKRSFFLTTFQELLPLRCGGVRSTLPLKAA